MVDKMRKQVARILMKDERSKNSVQVGAAFRSAQTVEAKTASIHIICVLWDGTILTYTSMPPGIALPYLEYAKANALEEFRAQQGDFDDEA